MAFQNDSLSKRYDPSEYDYYRWHPITLGSAYMTERRIMDMAVSYTHLDVYKRQNFCTMIWATASGEA